MKLKFSDYILEFLLKLFKNASNFKLFDINTHSFKHFYECTVYVLNDHRWTSQLDLNLVFSDLGLQIGLNDV